MLFFTIFYCSYLSMHEVKKPFAGIKKLSIWHGKPFFLLQKPFFLKIKPFKKNLFFHKVELTARKQLSLCVRTRLLSRLFRELRVYPETTMNHGFDGNMMMLARSGTKEYISLVHPLPLCICVGNEVSL